MRTYLAGYTLTVADMAIWGQLQGQSQVFDSSQCILTSSFQGTLSSTLPLPLILLGSIYGGSTVLATSDYSSASWLWQGRHR